MEIISTRLRNRGLVPIEINRLIKDVSNVIDRGLYYTPVSVKQGLQNLGWEGHILDNYVLELIFLFLDDEGKFDIYKYSAH